ncbi:MAG: prolipoprotein diacylglyceryl transferase [Clostridia bacterium]|nr:prolipoprotein diacylglyceryl transferase [Clostridia bacterium]
MSPGRYVAGPITWYSFLILCGMLLAIFLGIREERRKGLPEGTVIDLALLIIPFGILGARLYYVLFTLENYLADPILILYIWEGGLAIYGGLIAGLAAALVYCRRKKLSLLKALDCLAPGVVLAQGIGRWGNFFNSEAYGLEITRPAWQFFPFGVLIDEGGTPVWHLATFFYESCWNLLVFALLWGCRRRFRRDGDCFLWYTLLYACGRQFIEGLRLDSLYSFTGNLRVSQALAIAAAVAVLVWFFLRARRTGNVLIPALIWGSGLAAGLAFALLNSQSLIFCAFFWALTPMSALLLYRLTPRTEVENAHR